MASGAVSGFSSTNTAFAPTGRSGTSSIGSNSTTFTFDKVFWSMCAGSEVEERRGSLGRCPAPYASQNSVFEGENVHMDSFRCPEVTGVTAVGLPDSRPVLPVIIRSMLPSDVILSC